MRKGGEQRRTLPPSEFCGRHTEKKIYKKLCKKDGIIEVFKGETLHRGEVQMLALDLPLFHLLLLLPLFSGGSAGVAFQRVALNPCYSRQHSSLIWSHVMPGRGGREGGGEGGGGERGGEEGGGL